MIISADSLSLHLWLIREIILIRHRKTKKNFENHEKLQKYVALISLCSNNHLPHECSTSRTAFCSLFPASNRCIRERDDDVLLIFSSSRTQSFFLSAQLFLIFFFSHTGFLQQEQVIKFVPIFRSVRVSLGTLLAVAPREVRMDRGVPNKTWYVCVLCFGIIFFILCQISRPPDLPMSYVLEMEIQLQHLHTS